MRRGITLGFLASLVAVALFGALFNGPQATKPSTHDVVMLRCSVGTAGFPVTVYDGSTAAPSVKQGRCPEVLSQLLREDFDITHVGHHDRESDFVVYTLKR